MSDKRKVTTDALDTLGTIITEGERDAIHLAVEPVIAGETLYPGYHIGIKDGKATTKADKMVGIVDPFLQTVISEGQKFWLIVYPRQITSLRHVWSHPDFEEAKVTPVVDKGLSEQWLRNWCEGKDCAGYERIMQVCEAIADGIELPVPEDNDYGRVFDVWDDNITFMGVDSHTDVPDEFWIHFEIVTGKKMPHRITYFGCSC